MSLLGTHVVRYDDIHGWDCARKLRVFHDKVQGQLVAVVTEGWDDTGMSVTNAAGQVWPAVEALIARKYPKAAGRPIMFVEHYPATGEDPESFDWVRLGPTRWTRLDTGTFKAEVINA